MERLTYRIDNIPDGESGVWVEQHDYISAAEKLADYEDAEEQGLLIRLPCKIGETLYFTHDKRVIASEVLSVKYHAEAENHGVFAVCFSLASIKLLKVKFFLRHSSSNFMYSSAASRVNFRLSISL